MWRFRLEFWFTPVANSIIGTVFFLFLLFLDFSLLVGGAYLAWNYSYWFAVVYYPLLAILFYCVEGEDHPLHTWRSTKKHGSFFKWLTGEWEDSLSEYRVACNREKERIEERKAAKILEKASKKTGVDLTF